jgi:hypothetical protein
MTADVVATQWYQVRDRIYQSGDLFLGSAQVVPIVGTFLLQRYL